MWFLSCRAAPPSARHTACLSLVAPEMPNANVIRSHGAFEVGNEDQWSWPCAGKGAGSHCIAAFRITAPAGYTAPLRQPGARRAWDQVALAQAMDFVHVSRIPNTPETIPLTTSNLSGIFPAIKRWEVTACPSLTTDPHEPIIQVAPELQAQATRQRCPWARS